MSKKLPALKADKIVRTLLRAGFYVYHQRGSHIQLRHSVKTELRVTIPRHDNFDLPPFVINSILKQDDLTKDKFLKLL